MKTGEGSDESEESLDIIFEPDARPLLKAGAPKITKYVILLCSISTIGGFLFGYDTGVVSGALVELKQEMIVGVAVAAAALGAIIGGLLSNHLGRKITIMISSVFFCAGSILLFTAPNYILLVVGRIVLGMGVGLASMVVPAYIAECAPALYRGKLVTGFGVSVTTGQFIASVIDGCFSSVTEGWRWMLGIALLPSVILGAGMFLLPESPRYLIQKSKIEEAEKVMKKINGVESVSEEIQEMKEVIEAETEYSNAGITAFLTKVTKTVTVRRAIVIGCALQCFQQLGGINTVMYYSTTMIKMAGVKDNTKAIWLSCIPSFCNSLFSIVSLIIVERFPRRILLLSTLFGTIIGLVLLGGSYYVIERTIASVDTNVNPSSPYYNEHCSVSFSNCDQCVSFTKYNCSFCSSSRSDAGICMLSTDITASTNCTYSTNDVCYSRYSLSIIVAMVIYIAMFATGIGTLAWTINSEIYPMWVRGYAMSLSTLTNWSFNLVIAFTFLDLSNAITKYGAFWLYAGITIIGWIFFYLKLPETRGVPLEQVDKLFADTS